MAPQESAAARRSHRAARDLDLDVTRDRIGIVLRPRVHLNPRGDRNAVGFIPADDLDTAVHARIDVERLARRLHPGFANLTVTGALAPIPPASVATILQPFVVTILSTQTRRKNQQDDSDRGEMAHHSELRECQG